MPQDFEPTSRTNTLTHCGCRQKLLSRCLFRSALDINLTLQIRAFLDRNPLRGNVAVYHGTLTQFDAVAGLHVAVKFPLNNHAFGLNRCFDLAVHHDRESGVVVLEYASEGRVVATGAAYGNRYISVLTIVDRKVTRWRDYLDPIAVFEAVGWPPRA